MSIDTKNFFLMMVKCITPNREININNYFHLKIKICWIHNQINEKISIK